MSDFTKFLSPIRIEGRPAALENWSSTIWDAVNGAELVTKAGVEYLVGTFSAGLDDNTTVAGGEGAGGKYVTLNASGLLDPSVLPSLAITDTHVITDITGIGAIDANVPQQADVGDIAIFNPTLTQEQIESGNFAIGTYICSGNDGTTRTWTKLTTASDGIITINGLSDPSLDLGLEDIYAVKPGGGGGGTKVSILTSITAYGSTASEDYKFPTAKAVSDFVSNASNLTSGTISNDRLTVATTMEKGIASFDSNNFTVSDGVVTLNMSTNVAGDSGSDTLAASAKAVATYVDDKINGQSVIGKITGDGTTNTFALKHRLGKPVIVQVYDNSGNLVFVPTTVNNTTATFNFAVAPELNTVYKVYIMALNYAEDPIEPTAG